MVDYAPAGGYTTNAIEAVPGWLCGEMSGGDGFARYGPSGDPRRTNFLILDWAFQTDPGDPD